MPDGIDTQKLGQITAAFMQQLDELQRTLDGLPAGCVVGDMVIVAEIKRPDGTSTYAVRFSDPPRRHVAIGLLDVARDIAKANLST